MSNDSRQRRDYRQGPPGRSGAGLHAAYNFVPLSRWIHHPEWAGQVSHDIPFEDGLCGHLDIRIKAHTPILVGKEQDRAKPLSFNRLPDGTPAIPGSTLRGMIRNVIEIAGFGKLRLVDDSRFGVRDLTNGAIPFYRQYLTRNRGNQTYEPLSKAGWLNFDRDGWKLTRCEHARVERHQLLDYLAADWVRFSKKDPPSAREKYDAWARHKGFKIHFQAGPEADQPHSGKRLRYRKAESLGAGPEEGYLVFTGQPGPNKHMEFVFFGNGDTVRIPEERANDFLAIHEETREWRFWSGKTDQPAWRDQFDKGIPVFYLQESDGAIKSLGLAQMFKLAYRHSVEDMIRHTQPLHCNEAYHDLADLIFGTAHSQDPSLSLKGRADFSSAACTEKNPAELPPKAVILGSPKPTFYPNYVVQNADGGLLKGREYSTYDGAGVEIRGWKRYPVRKTDPLRLFPPLQGKQRKNDKVQVRLQPLDQGVEFTGKLRFHNLKPVELGALAWALSWNADPRYRHALGLGKPLGLGQISIDIAGQHILANNRHQSASEPPTWRQCTSAFVDHMEKCYRDAQPDAETQGWMESEQLVQLLTMADPGVAPGQPGDLSHPRLEPGRNEFLDAKKQFRVLPEYTAYSGRRDRDIDWSEDTGAEGVGKRWLDKKLKALSAQHHSPEATLLFGRLLATEWNVIEDSELKEAVLAVIQERWQEAGRWEQPQGKSAKAAHGIYNGKAS